MSYLVDANVLSEATRESPDAKVLAWIEANEADLFLSAITVGELQRGVALYAKSRKRAVLEKWLGELLGAFEGRILPVDQQVALAWGEYYAAQQLKGRKPPALNSMVAATARVHGLTVASRNLDDFPDTPAMNPWAQP
jgi:predicted nucleic acid-binding protein